MIKYITFLILLFNSFLHAQNAKENGSILDFYERINLAQSRMHEDSLGSLQIYYNAINEYKFYNCINRSLYEVIKLSNSLKQFPITYQLLLIEISKGVSMEALNSMFLGNPDFKEFSLKYFEKLNQEYDELRLGYLKNFDFELYNASHQLHIEDQAIRKALTGLKIDSLLLPDFQKNLVRNNIIEKIDCQHIMQMERILKDYIKIEMGRDSNAYNCSGSINNLFIILFHSLRNDSTSEYCNKSLYYRKLQPILLDMFYKGIIDNNFYASIIDRANGRGSLKMEIYGMELNENLNERGKRTFYYPIYDIETVDIRRKSIGLIPLYRFCEISNVELPIGYKY